jgi:glycogen debranching enzyme
MTTQRFVLGSVDWQDERDSATPYFLSNPRMYLVGSIGGAITPYGDEHLVGKMGGLWAHPMRMMQGWQVRIDGQVLAPATHCTVYAHYVERVHQHAGLQVVVQETLHPNLSLLSVQVQIHNQTADSWQGTVAIDIVTDIRGCWFGGIDEWPMRYRVFAHSVCFDREGVDWQGVAVARNSLGWRWQVNADVVSAQSTVTVAPQTPWSIDWVLAVDHEAQTEATALAKRWCGKHTKIVAREGLLESPMTVTHGVRLITPDAALNDYWQVATHNLRQLVTQPHQMPIYFLAGIPEYPQVFGCDTAYAVPGLMAAGFGQGTQSVLAYLAAHANHACGRVPHEITTNGRVFHPGNAQETPQFAVACWQYVRWSGDDDLAYRLYTVCAEGMQHVMGVLNGHHWPYGDGMVERHGMGPFKLDTVCYIYQALVALADWATADRHVDEAQVWRTYATNLAARFEQAWWLEKESLYADSLQRDGTPQLDRHWTAIVPVQTQIASPARQQAVYQQVRQDLVNQWGLMHTKGDDERVWTLPTGLLALSAFAQHDSAYGVELLRSIGSTARVGSLGLMKELIPQGICFIQLWSAALFVQGIVVGLCGIEPDMRNHQITITPQLPAEWPEVRFEKLLVGNWLLDIVITQHQVTVHVHAGMADNVLTVWVVASDGNRKSKIMRNGFSETWQLR